MEVSQERFIGGESSDDDTLWNISLELAHKEQIAKPIFNTKNAVLSIPFKHNEWIKVNNGQVRISHSSFLTLTINLAWILPCAIQL